MLNIRVIRGRIKSAKNIAQITKAMELVAASKMKKAQAQASAGKLYSEKILEMVVSLAQKVDVHGHPLMTHAKAVSGKTMVILISTNKALCGGLNTNLFRYLTHEMGDSPSFVYVTLGKKGAAFVAHGKGVLQADFSETVPFIQNVSALSDLAIHQFTSGAVDKVVLVYSEFISALRQQPRIKTILPLTIEHAGTEKKQSSNTLIEPNEKDVLDALLPHYLENQIRDAILQADASEQSARMIAMRNATDNAKAFIRELTLVYNKVRQEKITTEISDMVTARLAVEG